MFSTAWLSPVGQRSCVMLMCQHFVRFLTARLMFCIWSDVGSSLKERLAIFDYDAARGA